MRRAGLSGVSLEQLRASQRIVSVVSVQNQFNPTSRTAEDWETPGSTRSWTSSTDAERWCSFIPASWRQSPPRGVHPTYADFLLDTTRAAISLVLNKVPRRYPDLKMILSHAGGFVPYAAHRIANLTGANPLAPTGSTQEEVLEDLAGFYFDIALSASPTSLPSLTAFANPDHVLFGSDWPHATNSGVAYFTQNLDHDADLDAGQHEAINRGNALQLVPRLNPTAAQGQ